MKKTEMQHCGSSGNGSKLKILVHLNNLFSFSMKSAAYGKHFASRYTRFHQLAETIAGLTEEDYLHRFCDVCNLITDLKKAVADEEDDYVFWNGEMLLTMDEFLRFAETGRRYHIGSICKYHQ